MFFCCFDMFALFSCCFKSYSNSCLLLFIRVYRFSHFDEITTSLVRNVREIVLAIFHALHVFPCCSYAQMLIVAASLGVSHLSFFVITWHPECGFTLAWVGFSYKPLGAFQTLQGLQQPQETENVDQKC